MTFNFLKKKKKEEINTNAVREVPVQTIQDLIGKGLSKQQIIDLLTKNGYSMKQIIQGFEQVKTKQTVLTTDASPITPKPVMSENVKVEEESGKVEQQPKPISSGEENKSEDNNLIDLEKIEALVEAIVDEKISDVLERVDEFEKTLEKIENSYNALSQELNSLKEEVNKVSKDYSVIVENDKRRWEEVKAELSATEKALQKLIPTLAMSIRELKNTKK